MGRLLGTVMGLGSFVWAAAALFGGCASDLDASGAGHMACAPNGACSPGFHCETSSQRCVEGSGAGLDAGSDDAGDAGDASDGCVPGTEGCPAPCGADETRCDGQCVELASDPLHCGACDTACDPEQVCGPEGCAATCPGELTNCEASCVDLDSAVDHCGDCETVCPEPPGSVASCTAGECGFDCVGETTACDGACVDTDTDPAHCGTCDNPCDVSPANGSPTCAGGACDFACDPGFSRCGSACVDTQVELAHCGGCDDACVPPPNGTATCSLGSCGFTCEDPTFPDKCEPGGCVDGATDPLHCGDCDTACADPVSGPDTGVPTCASSTCGVSCDAATALKCAPNDGGLACVDGQTDPQFCGDCATHCPAGKTCLAAACVDVCQPGETSCGGTCTNLKSDPHNCNSCGNGCPAILNSNNKCQNGGCQAACNLGFTACSDGSLTPTYACADLQTDPTHCGNCATACSADKACVAGVCTAFIRASACWECGNGNAFPLCCSLNGETLCTTGAVCP